MSRRARATALSIGLAAVVALVTACGTGDDIAAPSADAELALVTPIAAEATPPGAPDQSLAAAVPRTTTSLLAGLRDAMGSSSTGTRATNLGAETADAMRTAIVAALPVPAPAPTQAYFDEELVDLGRIVIPALGIDRTLHQGISLHNIDRGPSHWPGTATPGELGNVVIAGHRTTHGAPFRNIDQLASGDQVIFQIGDEVHVYVVAADEVVTPSGLHIVEQSPEHTATLFACHPPGSAQYRYVVHLELDTDAVVDLEPAAA